MGHQRNISDGTVGQYIHYFWLMPVPDYTVRQYTFVLAWGSGFLWWLDYPDWRAHSSKDSAKSQFSVDKYSHCNVFCMQVSVTAEKNLDFVLKAHAACSKLLVLQSFCPRLNEPRATGFEHLTSTTWYADMGPLPNVCVFRRQLSAFVIQ